jgi:V/A-type H+-transporting ATPase subunit E
MALDDLLRAIESDAAAERARAARETASQATAIVQRARRQASELEAELSATPEAKARAEAETARALARLDASGAVRTAQEEAFASLVVGVRAELAGLRETSLYRELFRALLAESRAALPAARRLRVDPRDLDLATPLAGGLYVDPALDTWGGIELASADGRIVRNTVEERLANAELLLRRQFAQWLAAAPEPVHAGAR